jgi:hypothetical protein
VSLLEFKAIQYRRRGNALATAVQLSRIEKFPNGNSFGEESTSTG